MCRGLQGIPADMGDRNWVLLTCAGAYVLLSVLVGSAWTAILHRRTAVWFAQGRRPTPPEARRALRLPRDLALVSGTLWLGGTIILGTLTSILGSALDTLGVTLAVGLPGAAAGAVIGVPSRFSPAAALVLAAAFAFGGGSSLTGRTVRSAYLRQLGPH